MRTSAEFTIKQGETYRMRVYFQVYYNIVFQLKYKNIVKKLGFTTKQEQVMGSFSPTKEEHVIDLEEEVAPSGIFARGAYKGKSLFIDGDECVHMQYEYSFRIAKDWD